MNVTYSYVDAASKRLVGMFRDCSAAQVSAAAAAQMVLQNQLCGHKQLDMLSLLLEQSRPDRQLVKVFSALLPRIVSDDDVATCRGAGTAHWQYARIIGWRPV